MSAPPGLPPSELRERVAGSDDPDWFVRSGIIAIDDLAGGLAAAGRTFGDYERIYDFGCGCGRITVPLAARLGAGRLTATDSDAAATEWLRRRLPQARVATNGPLPPTPFGRGAFDLIIGWSVFSHLPEDYQDAWLAELRRLLRPGGVALLTVHGPHWFDAVGSAPDDRIRNELPERGFIHYVHHPEDSPFPSYYQTAFHTPGYIREHWSRWLEVVAVREGAARPTQDMVTLRRERLTLGRRGGRPPLRRRSSP